MFCHQSVPPTRPPQAWRDTIRRWASVADAFFRSKDVEHRPPARFWADVLGITERTVWRMRAGARIKSPRVIGTLLELRFMQEIGEFDFPKLGDGWISEPIQPTYWFALPDEPDDPTTERCALCHSDDVARFESRPSGKWAYCQRCWKAFVEPTKKMNFPQGAERQKDQKGPHVKEEIPG